ncbi:MAG: discoidin domain-containing protein, partial [Bacteroidales bacterium]
TFRISDYTENEFNNLYAEFDKVEKVPSQMEADCKNELLMKELRPWLTEFGKLGTRGKKSLDLIKISKSGDNAGFWNSYVANLMSEEQKKAYNEHKSGTMKLQPFYENAMDDMVFDFYKNLTGEIPQIYLGVGTYNNLSTPQSKLMFDNDSTTHYTSGIAQKTGNWIGTDLRTVREVSEIVILQGRNSVDDVDYFDHTILEYSADGKTWEALTPALEKQYIITWTGAPVKARYVRIRKLESAKKNWAAVRIFDINPISPEKLGFAIEAADTKKALYAFDKNPASSYISKETFSFGLKTGTTACTLLTKLRQGSVVVKQLGADQKVITEERFNSAYINFTVQPKVKKIVVEGDLEIFEVITK